MTYKIYIDEKGVPKWNPKFQEVHSNTIDYMVAIREAKSESVEFENVDFIIKAWESMSVFDDIGQFIRLTRNSFYDIQIDGRIEIKNGKAVIIPSEFIEGCIVDGAGFSWNFT